MGKCIDNMFQCILCTYKQVSKNLKFDQQKTSLSLLCEVLKHEQTRKFMLMNLLFRKIGYDTTWSSQYYEFQVDTCLVNINFSRFANFMHLKPLDEPNLADVVPDAWWPSNSPDPERDRYKKSYMESVQRIREATSSLEEMQVEMLLLLLDNSDGTKVNNFIRQKYQH